MRSFFSRHYSPYRGFTLSRTENDCVSLGRIAKTLLREAGTIAIQGNPADFLALISNAAQRISLSKGD
jgi:hypothetical protein